MLEKVARAIYASHPFNDNHDSADPGFDGLPKEWREVLKDNARAAIEAMREPTEAMRHAGFSADAFRTPMARMETDFEPKAVFEAMIDAALSPSGEK